MKIVNVHESFKWVVSYLTIYLERKTDGIERIFFFYLKMGKISTFLCSGGKANRKGDESVAGT